MPARTLVLFTAVTLFADSAATAGVLVAFREKVTVEHSLLTLGDVAEVHSAATADVQRLSAVILGPAPAAGRDAPMTFETVRSRMLAAGINLADVEFSGPATITVSGGTEPSLATDNKSSLSNPAQSRIEHAVNHAIRRYLAVQSRGSSFEVAARIGEEAARVLAGSETRGLDVSGGQPPWTGNQTFVLRLLDESEQIREVQVACVVSARPSVLAAKHALPRNHVIRPDDLVWKKAESAAEASCMTDPKELLGHETQQPIRSGQAFSRDTVKTLPLVRSGQFVTVSSRKPGLAVQRVMKARTDGAFGEVIAFQTLEDHKTILARVTGVLEADIVDKASAPTNSTAPPIASEALARDSRPGPVMPVAHLTPSKEATGPSNESHRMHVNPTQTLSVPRSPVDP